MALQFACQDVGVTCDFIAKGETEEELLEQVAKHAKEVHGYTDEQLNDPEMMKKVKSAVKQA